MKFIFPIVAILVCGGGAYFSLQLSENFQVTQDARLLASNTNKTITASIDKTNSDIESERKLLDEAKTKLAVAAEKVNAALPETVSLRKELSKLKATIKAQELVFETNEKSLQEVKQLLSESGLSDSFDAANLADRIADFETKSKELDEKMDEQETLSAEAEEQLKKKKSQVQVLVDRKKSRDQGIALNALEARILSVDMEWGFVVIGAGANSGFKPQTSLLIKRDGRYIGKVEPYSVEATQTIGEIDFKSLPTGVRIQPGDLVILAKPNSN
jgi:DNA polymerase III alpha subunit (gram-positive type)